MKNVSVLGKLLSLVMVSVLVVGCGSSNVKDSQQSREEAAAAAAAAEAQRVAAAEAAAKQAEEARQVRLSEQRATLTTVFYFDFDQSALKPETRAALDAAAEYLKETNGSIRIEGHADERGSREYNMALGERRAKAVVNYLAIQGVDRNRFDIISYGEERPAMTGHSEGSWSKNRRAELVL